MHFTDHINCINVIEFASMALLLRLKDIEPIYTLYDKKKINVRVHKERFVFMISIND